MLDVIFYQSTSEISYAGQNPQDQLIICPSPLVADGLRRQMPEHYEIITISKFIGDYLKKCQLSRTNKAGLILRLSSVWRHYFSNEEAHLFFKAFEIFTEIRSFSLSLDLLSDFLKELDPVTHKSILIFWTFLESEKIIDEHRSYQIASEIEADRQIWVVGFKHLSGIQIDMLKQISENTTVKVFIPKQVYKEAIDSDWLKWLVPSADIEDTSKVNVLKIAYFPRNKLNIVLPSLKKIIPVFDIALAATDNAYSFKQEVSTSEQFIKSSEDLFLISREQVIEELEEVIGEKTTSIEVVKEVLEDLKKKSLNVGNYLRYKVLLLTVEAIEKYSEFQTTVDTFSLKIINSVLELNAPRTSLVSLGAIQKTRLYEINELPFRENNYPLVMIASSQYGSLKSGEGKYSEKMIEALKVIAPLKRSGLDFSYLKNDIIESLSKEGSVLLLEDGLEQIDLSWREILKCFQLELLSTNTKYKLKESNDYLDSLIKKESTNIIKFSASRIQTFLDCPRKYYFSYVEKLDHRPDERLSIAADEMGIIEHEIIESYFNDESFNEELFFKVEKHQELCIKSLDEFIDKKKCVISEKSKLASYYELLHYTQNAIEYLINFCNEHKAIMMKFECSLGQNKWNLVGSIDCLVYLPENNIALFDFKRSGTAIGSKKETLIFNKVQIWTYLLILVRSMNKSIHTWGYLNLSEIKSSQIYSEWDSLFLNDEILDKFEEKLSNTIECLKSEKSFLPIPRNIKVCHFCDVQLLCHKGNLT